MIYTFVLVECQIFTYKYTILLPWGMEIDIDDIVVSIDIDLPREGL